MQCVWMPHMRLGVVAFVAPKVVPRIQVGVLVAQRHDVRITSNFGQDGRCSNAHERLVTVDHGRHAVHAGWVIGPIHQDVVGCERQIGDGTRHGAVGGVVDVVLVDFVDHLGVRNARRPGVALDKVERSLGLFRAFTHDFAILDHLGARIRRNVVACVCQKKKDSYDKKVYGNVWYKHCKRRDVMQQTLVHQLVILHRESQNKSMHLSKQPRLFKTQTIQSQGCKDAIVHPSRRA